MAKRLSLISALFLLLALAPAKIAGRLPWRVAVEVAPSAVLGTNGFLRGVNERDHRIGSSLTGSIRTDFGFDPSSMTGRLYPGLYQGLGVDFRTFFANDLLGTPTSVYVYQGAPIVNFGRLSLDYEWQFGAAFGWRHYDKVNAEYNAAVSTPVTAQMGVSLKLRYRLTDRWQATVGLQADHFSNGNTSQPNAGVNTLGASAGVAYLINAPRGRETGGDEAAPLRMPYARRWFVDFTAYWGWRKRVLTIDGETRVLNGHFAVAGVQLAPMWRVNRFFATGVSVDGQYDESADLARYRAEGSWNDGIKFYRPPFERQLSVGLAAHAELTMPIFSVNAGIGVNLLNPNGEKRFYQSLTLKAFVLPWLYLNAGYRIGDFKDPQNLMLGLGCRI